MAGGKRRRQRVSSLRRWLRAFQPNHYRQFPALAHRSGDASADRRRRAVKSGRDAVHASKDAAGSLLYDAVMMVATRGAWGQVTLGVPDASMIRMPKRSRDGAGKSGWWPIFDNIVVAGAVAPVPGPATLPLPAGALALLGTAVPLRRRCVAGCQSKTHRGM